MTDRPRTYREFWPYYLRQHRDRRNRAVHSLGSCWALVAVLAVPISGDWLWLPAALLGGYGLAWFGHLVFERNRPTTFEHPFWSLVSDYRMLALWAAGGLDAELRAAESD